MYQKYHTDAIVLRNYERGEADKVFALLTRDFGLIWARASSVRRESSRQRYALQTNARVHLSLIRGSRSWRVAGARSIAAIPAGTASSAAFARIGSLVERLAGEEQNQYLFETLTNAHAALAENAEPQSAIELISVARVLYALGYLSVEAFGSDHASFSAENVRDPASRRRAPALQRGPIPASLFAETSLRQYDLEETEAHRTKILSSVNKALSETHL